MESFGKDKEAYKKFKEAMLKPVPIQEEGDDAVEQEDFFEGMPPEEKLEYFSLNASMLSHTTIEISVLIQMANEKGIDVESEMEAISKKFNDFYALGSGERSFREMSEATKELFWKLREKVANDEKSFDEVLKRTKRREEVLLQERDSYLAGD